MGFFKDFGNFIGGDYDNPADYARVQLNKIPQETYGYNEPFYNAGVKNLPGLSDLYTNMSTNPYDTYSGIMSKFDKNIASSPAFKTALQRQFDNSEGNANAAGMWGTPAAREDRYRAGNVYEQDQRNNFLNQNLGIMNTGIAGRQKLVDSSQRAGEFQANHKANVLGEMAGLDYKGMSNRNDYNAARNKMLWSSMLKAAKIMAGSPDAGNAFSMFNPINGG